MPPSPFATGLNREISRLRTANRKLRFHADSDDVVPKSARLETKSWMLARLPGLILACFGRFGCVVFCSRCEAFGAPISLEEHTSMMPRPAAKVRILHFKYLRQSDMASVLITTFEIFTRVSPNNSLERLTERSVGIVTDRPSDVYELFVTLL